MSEKDVYVTKTDMVKLRNLLEDGHIPEYRLKKLKGVLDCANLVESRGVLEDYYYELLGDT
jgi:hypothetical protein